MAPQEHETLDAVSRTWAFIIAHEMGHLELIGLTDKGKPWVGEGWLYYLRKFEKFLMLSDYGYGIVQCGQVAQGKNVR